ncbi:MAG: hypothetical protein AB7I25_06710 [Vicinamibacterales bacterium]
MFADDFLPVFDVSDTVATVVNATPEATWSALMDVDLLEVGRKRPLVAVLGALRVLPDLVSHLAHGEPLGGSPARMRFEDLITLPMNHGGWVLLGRREREEIALGLVGRFWKPVIEYAPVTTAAAFRAFEEPGFAKTVYALSVASVPGGRTLLSGVMRTATTDDHARRWFRRYWTLGVGSGAHVLVNGLLDVVREAAEGGPDLTHGAEVPVG